MPRCHFATALAAALCFAPAALPADPGVPTGVDRVLAVQSALSDARDLVTANKPAAAVELLEKNLHLADGSRP
ncbi:MAG: hypothetical protein ACRC7O_14170, partial [Fimbriiglobus sp.]